RVTWDAIDPDRTPKKLIRSIERLPPSRRSAWRGSICCRSPRSPTTTVLLAGLPPLLEDMVRSPLAGHFAVRLDRDAADGCKLISAAADAGAGRGRGAPQSRRPPLHRFLSCESRQRLGGCRRARRHLGLPARLQAGGRTSKTFQADPDLHRHRL